MAVPLGANGTSHAGTPAPLFSVNANLYGGVYDVASDGRRFIFKVAPTDQGSPPLNVVVHWTALLARN